MGTKSRIHNPFKAKTVRVPECEAFACRGHLRHGRCDNCGVITCSSTIGIENSLTLRRKKLYICDPCSFDARWKEKQKELARQRTLTDWEKVTVPVDGGALTQRMPEQYASKARSAVRAFFDAGFDEAVVTGSDVSTLMASARTLGLNEQVYAELRDGETVLRRIGSR